MDLEENLIPKSEYVFRLRKIFLGSTICEIIIPTIICFTYFEL